MEGNEINHSEEGSADVDQKRDSPSPSDRLESVRTSTPKANISIDSAVTVREFELEAIESNAHVFVNDEFVEEEEGHVGGAGEAMELDNVYENNQIMPRQRVEISLQTYPLHVPCLTCSTLFPCPEELKLHCDKIHRNNSQELFEMSMCKKGLISCQLCGIFQEWNIDSVFSHYQNIHGIPNHQGFQRQTEIDKRASDMAASLKCRQCQNEATFQGIRAWTSHYQQVHHDPAETDDSLIGMIADQLGNDVATRCRKCKAAVSVALAHKHLRIDCQPGHVKRKDINFESLNNGRTLKGYRVHDATFLLKCPLCPVTLKKVDKLQHHYQTVHHESPLHILQQRILEISGLISCQVCFIVTRRHPHWLVGHARSHHLNLFKYCFLFGKSLPQSENEKEASRLVAKVKCPLCKDDRVTVQQRKDFNPAIQIEPLSMSLFQLLSHLKEAHLQTVPFDRLLYLVADQLNLDTCNRCERAVAKEPEGEKRHTGACRGGQWMMPLDVKSDKGRQRDTRTGRKGAKDKENAINWLADGHGLISCRLCGCVRQAIRFDLTAHIKMAHHLKFEDYLKRTESLQPLVQSAEERNADAKVSHLVCERCSLSGISGITAFKQHMTKCQGYNDISKQVRASRIIGKLAHQLGLVRCKKCFQAVLPSKVKDHDDYHAGKHVDLPESETKSREKGLLSCSLCGCVRKAKHSSYRLHLRKFHNFEYQEDQTAKGKPFLRNSEVKNGAKGLDNIQCPTCKRGGLVGLREYRKHLIKSHGCPRLSLTFNHMMYQLAPSLGFKKCGLCRSAILRSKADVHMAYHRKKDLGSSLRSENKNGNLQHCQQEEASSNLEANGPTKDILQSLQSTSKRNATDFMSVAINTGTSLYSLVSAPGEQTFMRPLEKDTGTPQPSNTERSSKSNVSVAFQGPLKEKVIPSQTSLPAPETPTKTDLDISISKEKRTDKIFPVSKNPTKGTFISKRERGPRRIADKVLWRKSSTTTENFLSLWLALLRPRCPFCKDLLHSEKKMERHLQLKHAREHQVSKHQKRGKMKEMTCGLCSKTMTADLDSLRFHLAKEHASKSIDCTKYLKECGLTFVGQMKLKYPLLMHLCPWCDKYLPSIAELRAHADAEHNGGEDGFLLELFQTAFSGLFFGCPLCDKRIDMSYNAVETHVNVRHLGMDAARFLQLFYQTIKLEWHKQVFGKDEIRDLTKCQGKSLPSKKSKAATSSPLKTLSDLDGPIDVIDLCSDDEEAVFPQDKQEENESKAQTGKQDAPLDLSLPTLANIRKGNGKVSSVKKANLSPLQQGTCTDQEQTSAITNSESTCTYTCPKCKMGGFSSLSLAASHIKRIHNGHVESLAALKTSRVERYTTCKICGEKVLSDKVEVGYHLWSVHNLPLEAYDSL